MRCEVFKEKEKGTNRTIELTVTRDGEIGFWFDEDTIDSEAKGCYLSIDQTERLIEWLMRNGCIKKGEGRMKMRMNDVGVSMLWNVKFQYSELVLLSKACHEMQVHTKCMLVAASAAQDKETYEKAVKDYNRYESLAFMFDAKMRSVADEEVEV